MSNVTDLVAAHQDYNAGEMARAAYHPPVQIQHPVHQMGISSVLVNEKISAAVAMTIASTNHFFLFTTLYISPS